MISPVSSNVWWRKSRKRFLHKNITFCSAATHSAFLLIIVVCTAAVAIDYICLCVFEFTHRQILSIATAAVQITIMRKKIVFVLYL